MELSSFLKILKKHKFTIVIIPVVAVVVTYFLVRNQPDSYLSQAKIATGIVDQTQRGIGDFGGQQESEINQEFANLIEMLRSKRMLDQVSYKLMIHDLTSPQPYREPSELMQTLNASAKNTRLKCIPKCIKSGRHCPFTTPTKTALMSCLLQ